MSGAAHATGQAPCRPGPLTVPRTPGSVRRTSHLDLRWEGPGPLGTLYVAGAARDLVTRPDGVAEVLAEATMDAVVEADRRIRSLEVIPELAAPGSLVGTVVGPGFRAAAASAFAAAAGTPTGALVDDLPGAVVIAGYAPVRTMNRQGGPAPWGGTGGGVAAAMANACVGWREGGTAMAAVQTRGAIGVQDCPPEPAEDGDDAAAWHAMDALAEGSMRRRRRMDVVPGGKEVVVDSVFRDSYGLGEGAEVLHEYAVRLTLDAERFAVVRIEAEPRVLPFPECPGATARLGELTGVPVGELRGAVGRVLAGTAGCTHLNDLLRAVADAGQLLARVR